MNTFQQSVFIPTEISDSIVMPEEEVIITFRNSMNVKNIPLNGWFTIDIAALAKKFVVRKIQFGSDGRQAKQRSLANISDTVHEELSNQVE